MRPWERRMLNEEIDSIEKSIAMTKLGITRAREHIYLNNRAIEKSEGEVQSLENENSSLVFEINENQKFIIDESARLEQLRTKLLEATGEMPEPKPRQIHRPQTEVTISSFCRGPE